MGDLDYPVDPKATSKATGPEVEENGSLRDDKRRESRAKNFLERWPHSQAQSPRGQAKGPLKRLNTKGSKGGGVKMRSVIEWLRTPKERNKGQEKGSQDHKTPSQGPGKNKELSHLD